MLSNPVMLAKEIQPTWQERDLNVTDNKKDCGFEIITLVSLEKDLNCRDYGVWKFNLE